MTTKHDVITGCSSIAVALLMLSGSASAGTYTLYGSGPSYDTINGDIVTTTPPLATFSTGIELVRGTLTITGNSSEDSASVFLSGTSVVATRGPFRSTFLPGVVRKIVFYGNGANDSFTNRTGIPCEAYGGDGNDSLTGGTGDDFLVGGLGNDTLRGDRGDDVLWGAGGHDVLEGGEDDDLLKGHGGDDYLYGLGGADALYGGSGSDELSGGMGSDTLVSVGGSHDTVVGGSSADYFWADSTDDVIDASTTEHTEGYVHLIASYYRYSYTGGLSSTPVAKDLTDYDLDDPLPEEASDTLDNFADRPLFSSIGPTHNDVFQNAGDDCHILGPLSAVAAQTPDSIRKLVVDLGDGTYVVRMYRNAFLIPEYVRVDADLYVRGTGGLRYAGLGVDDSIWVPIVEKAFAFFRDRLGTYASIGDGNAGTSGSIIFGATSDSFTISPLYDAADVIAWFAAGRPSNIVGIYIQGMVPKLLTWIDDRLAEGRPVYTGYLAGSTNTTTLTTDNWRRGRHIIMIDRVTFDGNGNPNGLVIRDQIGGTEVPFTDVARLYHLFGRAHTYDMQ